MIDNLTKNILNTICYYDILNYPLTPFEIWKYLILADGDLVEKEYNSYSIADILNRLKHSYLSRFIENKKGFYFLRGRDFLVEQRIARGKISASKIKKMSRAVSLLRVVPFLRMVLITGRLAMRNAQPKSDWDVLVVVKKNRIWLGRTLVTLWAHILGKRRHHDRIKDRLCFNYFVTTDSLEIRNKDFFSANEYSFCYPLFDAKNYFHRFQLRNAWIRDYKPNYYLSLMGNKFSLKDRGFLKIIRTIGENILDHDFLERYLEKIEKNRINNNPKTSEVNSLIDVDKRALIFLPHPQGPIVFEKFKAKLEEIGADKK